MAVGDEDFLIRVDSLLSLIAHRHCSGMCLARHGLLRRECRTRVVTLPDDLRDEAIHLSTEARYRIRTMRDKP